MDSSPFLLVRNFGRRVQRPGYAERHCTRPVKGHQPVCQTSGKRQAKAGWAKYSFRLETARHRRSFLMKLSASLCQILLAGVAILGLTWAGAILAQRPVEEVTAPSNTTIVIVQQHDPGALREFVLLCRNAGAQ